eukprot:gene4433-3167_t
MNSASDILRLLQEGERARAKALAGGQYAEAVKEYEQIIKISLRLPNTIDESLKRKVQTFRSSLQHELKIMCDLQKEMDSFSQMQESPTGAKDVDDNRDPDVWAPPTPVSKAPVPRFSKRNEANSNNLPAWAKARAAPGRMASPAAQGAAPSGAAGPGRAAPSAAGPPSRVVGGAGAANGRKPSVPSSSAAAAAAPASRKPTTGGPDRKPAVPARPGAKTGGAGSGSGKGNAKSPASGERVKFSDMAREEGWADLELIEALERDIVEGKDADGENAGEDGGEGEEAAGPGRKTVIVLAATNTPWDLDEALRRRLEKRVYIPLPDLEGRKELFRINMRSVELDADVNLDELAEKSAGYSGADVANVCRDASMMSMRRIMEQARKQGLSRDHIQSLLKEQKDALNTAVSRADFLTALSKVNRSVSDQDLHRYQEWMSEYGSA